MAHDGYGHFDRTGVKKINLSLPQPYSERVALPLYFRVIVANLFALVGSLALLPAISISLDPAAYVYVLAYLLLAGLMFVIVKFTMGIKIRVRPMRALGGEKLDMLQIRGNRKELVYIPCKDITGIRQVEYQSSGWRTFLLGGAKTDKDQGHKMIQTGYCGPGLAVTYSSKPFFGSVEKTATQQFPSRRAGELAQRLRHHCND